MDDITVDPIGNNNADVDFKAIQEEDVASKQPAASLEFNPRPNPNFWTELSNSLRATKGKTKAKQALFAHVSKEHLIPRRPFSIKRHKTWFVRNATRKAGLNATQKEALRPLLKPIFKHRIKEDDPDFKNLTVHARGLLFLIRQTFGFRYPAPYVFQVTGRFDPHRGKLRIQQMKTYVELLEKEPLAKKYLLSKKAFEALTDPAERQNLLERMVHCAATAIGLDPPPRIKYHEKDLDDTTKAVTNSGFPALIDVYPNAFTYGPIALISINGHESIHAAQVDISRRFPMKRRMTGVPYEVRRSDSQKGGRSRKLFGKRRLLSLKAAEERDLSYAIMHDLHDGNQFPRAKNRKYYLAMDKEIEREGYAAETAAYVWAAKSKVFNYDELGILRNVNPTASTIDMREAVRHHLEGMIGISVEQIQSAFGLDAPSSTVPKISAEAMRKALWKLPSLRNNFDARNELFNALVQAMRQINWIKEDNKHPAYRSAKLLYTLLYDGLLANATPNLDESMKARFEYVYSFKFATTPDAFDAEQEKKLKEIAGDHPDEISRHILVHVAALTMNLPENSPLRDKLRQLANVSTNNNKLEQQEIQEHPQDENIQTLNEAPQETRASASVTEKAAEESPLKTVAAIVVDIERTIGVDLRQLMAHFGVCKFPNAQAPISPRQAFEAFQKLDQVQTLPYPAKAIFDAIERHTPELASARNSESPSTGGVALLLDLLATKAQSEGAMTIQESAKKHFEETHQFKFTTASGDFKDTEEQALRQIAARYSDKLSRHILTHVAIDAMGVSKDSSRGKKVASIIKSAPNRKDDEPKKAVALTEGYDDPPATDRKAGKKSKL